MESIINLGQAPRSDDLKRGIERFEREFEAYLVITFAGAQNPRQSGAVISLCAWIS